MNDADCTANKSANYALAWAHLCVLAGFEESTRKERAYSVSWLARFNQLPDVLQARVDFAVAVAHHNGA